MKRLLTLAALAAVLVGILSCKKIWDVIPPEDPDVPEERIPDDHGDGKPEDNNRKALTLAASSQALLQKTNSFAFHFLSRINASVKEDYIISPLSMQFLLGMILNGTQGTTAEEICQVLGYGAGEVDAVNEFALSMMEQLPGLDEKTVLNIANAIFVNQSYSIKDTYETKVVKYYDAEVANKDFQDPATLGTINQWASDHTNGMIPSVLDKIDPDRDLAILMNALFFKGQWTIPFPKESTGKEPFLKENGAKADADMMKMGTTSLAFRAGNGFCAVGLPYGNEAFSLVVLLPDEGKTVADVIAALGTLEWVNFLHSMDRSTRVNLWLPKFKTTTKVNLNGILTDMGMAQAFTPAADFKALSDNALRLTSVQQDAVIIVDEEGTEAAAVSTATVGVTSVPPPPVDFHADRPFLYLITESGTGAILFAGKYGGVELQ